MSYVVDYSEFQDEAIAMIAEYGTPVVIEYVAQSSEKPNKPWESDLPTRVTSSVSLNGVFVNRNSTMGKLFTNKDLLARAKSFVIVSSKIENIEKNAAIVKNVATSERFRVIEAIAIKPASKTVLIIFSLAV